MNEVDVKKLAEWAAKRVEHFLGDKHRHYLFCDNEWHEDEPDFPNDLNACFKWLVPDHDIVKIIFTYFDDDATCTVYQGGDWFEGSAEIGQDALALCRAFEQLIDNERK